MKKKKKRKITNSAGMTMAWMRKMGFLTAKVERWNPFAHVRVDLFGFADVLAIHEGKQGVFAIQTTWFGNFQDHKVKMWKLRTKDPLCEKRFVNPLVVYLKSGNPVWLVLWKKVSKETDEGEWFERKRIIPFVSYLSVEKGRVKFSEPLFAKEI